MHRVRYHFESPATPSKFHQGTFAFHSDDIEYVLARSMIPVLVLTYGLKTVP